MDVDYYSPQAQLQITRKGKSALPIPRDRLMTVEFNEKHRGSSEMTATIDNSDGLMWYVAPFLRKNSEINLSFGYPGRMRGPIPTRLAGPPTGSHTLNIKARFKERKKHKSDRDYGTKSRSWIEHAVTDIVEQIAGEMGYSGGALFIAGEQDFNFEKFEQITQTNETDLIFLHRLADMTGRRFWIDETGFHFQLPGQDLQPVATFRKAQNVIGPGAIIDYNVPELSTRVPGKVTLRARDPLTRTTIEHTAGIDDSGQPVLSGSPVTTSADGPEVVDQSFACTSAALINEAAGMMREIKLAAVKMELTVFGEPFVRPGSTIWITRIADPVDGLWYVRDAGHKLGSGYATELTVSREGYKKKRAKKKVVDAKKPVKAAGTIWTAAGQTFRDFF